MEPLQCICSVILKTRRDLYNRLMASKESDQPSGWKRARFNPCSAGSFPGAHPPKQETKPLSPGREDTQGLISRVEMAKL